MKVFISWSGERSRKVATVLKKWLTRNIQLATPWISSENIESGSIWFGDIKRELDGTSLGLICLTRENLNKPWILFEAGALAKGTNDNRVCTFLIDIHPSEMRDPLAQFNATTIEKVSFRKLVKAISDGLSTPLTEAVIDEIISDSWDRLEADIKAAIDETEDTPAPAKLSPEDMLSELLDLTRAQTNILRNLHVSSSEAQSSTLKLSGNQLLRALLKAPADNGLGAITAESLTKYLNNISMQAVVDSVVPTEQPAAVPSKTLTPQQIKRLMRINAHKKRL